MFVRKIVAALGVPASSIGENLHGNTAHRFSSARIDDEKVVEVFATIDDVLVEFGYLHKRMTSEPRGVPIASSGPTSRTHLPPCAHHRHRLRRPHHRQRHRHHHYRCQHFH